ncbi:hypothetical protein RchiOBHm_Chr1g0352921 [Rosa chinensis]|uniref:Uncharacterized protein n=1 Tax=Rosa chinensis TaxID=74649 RepID=A0A2P6SGQ1_ROSCH|nr:hypothetical protein RchiOBHm_Chr1g0352921 [Rosa chinensis]
MMETRKRLKHLSNINASLSVSHHHVNVTTRCIQATLFMGKRSQKSRLLQMGRSVLWPTDRPCDSTSS